MDSTRHEQDAAEDRARATAHGAGLGERVALLEQRVAALEAGARGVSPSGAVPSDAPVAPGQDPAAEPDPAASPDPAPAAPGDPETFWALHGLVDRVGTGVVYAGHLTPPNSGTPVSWQMGLSEAALVDLDFAEAAPALAALGHPARLSLLHAVHEGAQTVAELAADERFGTTGQIYHHINALSSAGWLESSRRGHWRVPARKLVPLLTLILIGTH